MEIIIIIIFEHLFLNFSLVYYTEHFEIPLVPWWNLSVTIGQNGNAQNEPENIYIYKLQNYSSFIISIIHRVIKLSFN